MAIIIPSKNIYDIDNPKVRDNVINNVSVEQNVIKPENEYDTQVADTIEETKGIQPSSWQEDADFSSGETTSYTLYSVGVAVGLRPSYKDGISLTIPKNDKTSFISSLFMGKDKDGNDNIKYTVEYQKYEGECFILCDTNASNDTATIKQKTLNYPEAYRQSNGTLPTSIERKETANISTFPPTAYKKIELDYITNLGENDILVEETEDYWRFENIKVLCAIETFEAGFKWVQTSPHEISPPSGELEFKGTCVKYVPLSVQITFYGDTIGISLNDGSITYGSGNKPYSLSGNELLQDSGKVKTIDESGNEVEKPITEHLATNILKQYERGKETATLLCSISDYYDYETNEKVIDTASDKMSFRLHDKVVPMVFGANGQDRPMSLRLDGSPKVFEVVGSKIFYDGAVWQQIILQETLDKVEN